MSEKSDAFILFIYRAGWKALPLLFFYFLGVFHVEVELAKWALHWTFIPGFEYGFALWLVILYYLFFRRSAKKILGKEVASENEESVLRERRGSA